MYSSPRHVSDLEGSGEPVASVSAPLSDLSVRRHEANAHIDRRRWSSSTAAPSYVQRPCATLVDSAPRDKPRLQSSPRRPSSSNTRSSTPNAPPIPSPSREGRRESVGCLELENELGNLKVTGGRAGEGGSASSTSSGALRAGVCFCCGSPLRFPSTVSCFRCTVCQTVNDLRDISSSSASVRRRTADAETLNVGHLTTALSELDGIPVVDGKAKGKGKEKAEKPQEAVGPCAKVSTSDRDTAISDIAAVLRQVFRSWDALNNCFVPSSLSTSSTTRLPVDMTSVRRLFALISSRSSEEASYFWHAIASGLDELLKRPGGKMMHEGDMWWLLIALETPLFFPSGSAIAKVDPALLRSMFARLLGLMSHLPNQLHHHLVGWLASSSPSDYPPSIFLEHIEAVNAFISRCLAEHFHGPGDQGIDGSGEASSLRRSTSSGEPRLLDYHGSGVRHGAHPAAHTFQHPLASSQSPSAPADPMSYQTDWRIRSAARVLALYHAASLQADGKVPIASFYCLMADQVPLIPDYRAWEQRAAKFSLCQYPFLLSLGAKMAIMEFDAQRQMDAKAREAFLSTLWTKKVDKPYLLLRVRRTHLIEDSLRQIAANELNLKKDLRVIFEGEEGVDAGGLRKEWFLLLVRQLFDPAFGMFTYDSDSPLCYFNPASLDSPESYHLVGVVIGLALFHGCILDPPLPLAVYKGLLGAPIRLKDLKAFRPGLASGLERLLAWETDDVEEVFCRSFVGSYEAYGEELQEELMPGGANIPVTLANRKDYVSRMLKFVCVDSVKTQFESFRDGFLSVCGGNALSLFRPEELELLSRGSPEPLEVDQLRAVTVLEGFKDGDVIVEAFWSYFGSLSVESQHKLLAFVTGSDRIPATGISNLEFKLKAVGKATADEQTQGARDTELLPWSHTCFNTLCLPRYATKEKLEAKLNQAITESEGFGLQ